MRVITSSTKGLDILTETQEVVNRHGFVVEKYGAALLEMRLAIQA